MRGNGVGVGWLEQGVRLCEGARNGEKDTEYPNYMDTKAIAK